jgi:hypothetical protein
VRNNRSDHTSVYELLSRIDDSFEQVLQEIRRVEQLPRFRKQALIKPARRAVEEARAWTLFEILEVLHAREEEEWIRLGHERTRREQKPVKQGGKST